MSSEFRPCPFCRIRVPADTLLQHTLPCMEKLEKERPRKILEPEDKAPNETWSQYYQRKGSRNLVNPPPQSINIPKKTLPPIPDYLKDNPFVVCCPYESNCGYMEAKDFPRHAIDRHAFFSQRLVCPICDLEGDSKINENLYQHLTTVHEELLKQKAEPIPEDLGIYCDYVPTGQNFVETTFDLDKIQECTICFEDFEKGTQIVRMDCFCIYHVTCISTWFAKQKTKRCPIHGSDQTK